MPVDPDHAFANGRTFPQPRGLDALLRLRAASTWRSFRAGAVVGPGAQLGPNAYCANQGPRERIALGAGVVCRGIVRREAFGDGTIVIGDDVYIGDDCILSCAERVEIGARTLLGHGVQIFDNNSHPTEAAGRARDWHAIMNGGAREQIDSAPVLIGEDVWLGFGSIVLKGVTIGDAATVGAGSVVTRDVAPGATVVGNPARTL